MFAHTLHRMIFFELARVFLLSLVGITGIMVMAGVVAEASQQGLTPVQVLGVIPLLIPSTLPYTIPATTLFATCVVYGRLSHDNEILAIKAAGINITKVLAPALFLGLLMSAVTMGLYYHLIPYTHALLRSQFLNEVEESLYTMLKRDRCIKQPGLNYCMWVRQVQGHRLIDALFKRQDPKTHHYDVIAVAREAELRYEPAQHVLMVQMEHCQLYTESGSNAGYVQRHTWPVDLPAEFGANKNPRPRALSYPQLFQTRQEKQEEIQAKTAEIALGVARLSLASAPMDLPTHIENLKTMCHQRLQEICALNCELNLRPALSCGCFCFVLVGCPVGIWLSRSDYLSAFISCFLPIVFIYYPMILAGTNMAKQGRVPAFICLWAANGIMMLAAAFLFRRLARN